MMLVDINLLPQKKANSFKTMILLIVSIAIFLGYATWLALNYYVSTSTLEQKEKILQQEKLLVQAQVNKQKQAELGIETKPLIEKIEYVRAKEIAAVELLQHLVALLPERGFFMKYEYRDKSSIIIEAQFDTLADTSHYLHELTNSPYLTQAFIEKMETSNFQELEEGKDVTAYENILPRYRSQYKIAFHKDKLQALIGEDNEGE
ncbi:hypothetical protein KUV80_10265 [Fictibacillus nanhaiensis]|uniref:PilN domain-containing protein n=1 Tax=Fictibacillus nanhaiensis TaxID=742169 RepID=UPI001C987E32|nr:hypothetical protein [Fictibacillus nanhaiensis]MBY6037042.1 hypothetical protein [Fictibacillus nanhaiensis]